jgi:lipopolysaccharide export system protein LptA
MLAPLAFAAALAAQQPGVAHAPPIQIRAAEVEYRYRDKTTVMTGKPLVTLTRADATLVCRRLVTENDDRGQIRRATCEGDVKLTRGERVVTCATAVFEEASGRLTCRGSPALRDGRSVMTGEELVYDLDADRVTLTRAKGTLVEEPGKELPLGRRPGAQR